MDTLISIGRSIGKRPSEEAMGAAPGVPQGPDEDRAPGGWWLACPEETQHRDTLFGGTFRCAATESRSKEC